MEFIKKDYLERIGRLRMLDDDFMSKVFEDPKCAEILLRIILNRKDLTVQHVQVQHCIHNLQGRSVRLDIYAVDTTESCMMLKCSGTTAVQAEKEHVITAA